MTHLRVSTINKSRLVSHTHVNGKALFATLFFALLAGCGSGESTLENPNTFTVQSANYDGPAPSTTDVQNFKLNVWDNLVSSNRCGACHGAGGQSPTFVRDDDINLAYGAANTIVNLADAATSLMVTKVGGGHNCWLASDSACADTLTSYIENWAGGSASAQTEIVLRAPQIKDPGQTKTFPADSSGFTGVHALLETYCSNCHVEGQQTPFIGSSDIDVSYAAAQSRINLETPSASRLVQRLRTEFHNCWNGDCTTSSNEMETAIDNFASSVPRNDIDSNLQTSKALALIEDGIAANTGGRIEDNVIAQFEFKTGEGAVAYDTSGIEPALNLTLSGNVEWVGGWGLRFGSAYTDEDTNINVPNGKAQATTTSSRKLHSLITATNEYSIEAWVIPNNVTQENARIVSYSGSETSRNVALGQTLYNYDVLQRSSTTNQNEAFSTADEDERLQATQQHVVVTFNPGEGRKIYVNGEYTQDLDPEDAGQLSDWDDSFAFVLGNETDGNSLWQGSLRMVAVHNRALTAEQIQQNYEVGVGEKFFLLFSISHLIGVDDAFIVFEVSQFDEYSYLFVEPFFTSLDPEVSLPNINIDGMRIGINAKEAPVGQAFERLSVYLNDADYINGRQTLSTIGTIIPLELGPESDEFFLSFEDINGNANAFSQPAVPSPATPSDLPTSPDIGLKTFDEINATMSAVTTVPLTTSNVEATFTTVRQQMPTTESIDGFVSAHQMAITQLAIQYCDALVESTSLRSSYFPSFDFSAAANVAFDTPTKRSYIFDPLLSNMVGETLTSQPSDTDIEDELNDLVDILTSCGGSCASDRTETIVKASCAAVLGSAVILVQ
ncbi:MULTISPECIES: LamG domain-containing protein [unclassified Oleiphilus]|uniref:LamG domain-containing protein n=1 Tax=unclassified Oleiphilus TaxID=2631174 RepID=UPI000839705F|nr:MULTISPECIES: LamG domain-containing protein [unclassified Oleiphilus]